MIANRPQRTRRLFLEVVLLTSAIVCSNNALAHGDLDIRIAKASLQIAQDTNNAALYLQRGELHREHKDWAAAAADYDRAALLDPKIATVDFYRGRMLADAGQLAESLAAFGKFLQHNLADGDGYVERARVRVRSGELRAAVEDFTRGLELVREPQPEYFLERAQALVALGETNAALSGLDEGIKKLGPVVTLQAYAIELDFTAKNYDAAIARLNTVIAQASRKENWLARRGEIELLAGRRTEAQRSFEGALAAISILPWRLQENRPMAELKARVIASLGTITNAPATKSTDKLK